MSNAVCFVPDGPPRAPKPFRDFILLNDGTIQKAGEDIGQFVQCYRRVEMPDDWKAPEPPKTERPVLVPGLDGMLIRVGNSDSFYRAVPLAELRKDPNANQFYDGSSWVSAFYKGYRNCLERLGIHP